MGRLFQIRAAGLLHRLSTEPAHSLIAVDSDGHVDLTAYDTTVPLPHTDVPRRDLPFGVPAWHGTGGGTRSKRGSGAAFETQVVWTAP
jgi:hypothetical protein